MKQIFFVVSLFLFWGGETSLLGQTTSPTAEGGCNSARVTGGVPGTGSATPLWTGVFTYQNPCRRVFLYSNYNCSDGADDPRYTLQQLDSSGVWVNKVGPQGCPEFKNVSVHGTYRIAIQVPIEVDGSGCEGGHILVYNTNNQWIGYLGTYQGAPTYYTNTFVIGATTASDISYTFIDPTPNDPFETGYDFGELVKINTAASKNYDLWWLAIFEEGPTYQRYRSNGWTNGTVPNNEFDLTAFWGPVGSGWQFEALHLYKVQFVIENSKCRNGIEVPGEWNVLERTFVVCPAGTGCRIGEDAEKIVLSPNPASSVVRLLHFEMDAGSEYRLTIADLAGRAARSMTLTSNEVDISGFDKGMYAVTIERDGKRIFTDKLVVNQ